MPLTFQALEIEWLLACYGPALKPFTPLTGPEFAQEIAKVYSLSEPRNLYAFNLAKSLAGAFSMKHFQFTYTRP